ncbi:MAG: T9SS type A sorting domain-containing protein [Saprospiraceae bacterium]|nr:T9SS type A sorting domain-containing protein [Saprospiraceae bacterium]
MQNIRLLSIASLLMALIFGLANSSSHPTAGNSGYTGAPGDNVCSSCHSGSNPNFNGEVTINGLPGVIMTGTTYTITVTISNPNGNAARAGFQMLALTGTNTNAGTMSNNSANTQIKTVGGKNYFGHAPASNFSGNQSLSFTVNWTAPATPGSNPVINFYASALLANGNGSTSGDKMVLTTISVPIQAAASPLTVNVVPVSPTSCWNTSNGSASVNITGGMSPYGIVWSNGQTNTQTATNLPAGLVSVTVTDAAGASATGSTTIQSPPPININTSSTPSCANTASGTASALATGGTGALSYFWSNGMQGPQIAVLQPGTYTVSVFDANNCVQTSSATVTAVPQINISESVQNISCHGAGNGAISITASGGNGNFTYLWSNGQTQPNISNLPAGSYTVTVTSNNQCSTTRTYTITQPNPLVSTVQNTTGAGCAGQSNGSVTLVHTGGTAPYQTNIVNIGNFTGSVVNAQGLAAGNYSYTVTDQNNCVTSGSFQIGSFPQVAGSVTTSYNVCGENCSVTATVNASGGSAPFTYTWNNGQNSQTIIRNCDSNVSVTITDQNGCSAVVNTTINPPAPLSILSSTVNHPACHGQTGSAVIQTSGGVGNISVLWSDGGTGTGRNDLQAGIYYVSATDENMCTVVDTLIIVQPEAIEAGVEVMDATEAGESDGSITLNISGGTGPYVVLWNTGQTDTVLDSVPAGIYFYIITDANGCTLSGSVVVNNAFCFITAEVETTDPECFGSDNGRIVVIPASGEHEPNIRLFDMNGIELTDFANLPAGQYNVLISDTLGCLGVINNILLSNPPQIVADSIIAVQPSSDMASDGLLSAFISGGTGPLTYQWFLNENIPYSNESHLENVPNGIFTLVVTDSLGCEAMFGPFNFLLVSNEDISYDSSNSIRVFPNPVGDILQVVSAGLSGISTVEIISGDGRIARQFLSEVPGSHFMTLPVSDLPSGLYSVKIYGPAIRTFRIIKL